MSGHVRRQKGTRGFHLPDGIAITAVSAVLLILLALVFSFQWATNSPTANWASFSDTPKVGTGPDQPVSVLLKRAHVETNPEAYLRDMPVSGQVDPGPFLEVVTPKGRSDTPGGTLPLQPDTLATLSGSSVALLLWPDDPVTGGNDSPRWVGPSNGGGGIGAWARTGASNGGGAGSAGSASTGNSGTGRAGSTGSPAGASNNGTSSTGPPPPAGASNNDTSSTGSSAGAGNIGTGSTGSIGPASGGNRGRSRTGSPAPAGAGDNGTGSIGSPGPADAGDSGTANSGESGTGSTVFDGPTGAGDPDSGGIEFPGLTTPDFTGSRKTDFISSEFNFGDTNDGGRADCNESSDLHEGPVPAVPEPSSIVLLLTAVAGAMGARLRLVRFSASRAASASRLTGRG
jgi:hypothetical protein